MQKTNYVSFLYLSFFCSLLYGMDQRHSHLLLALPSDLKVEIISHLFCKNGYSILRRSDAVKQVRAFLLASRALYFDDALIDNIFERVARLYSSMPIDVWIDIPTPLSKKYLRCTTYNRMSTLIKCLLRDDNPIYAPQMNMLLELYPLAQYPNYYKGFEKKLGIIKNKTILSSSIPQSLTQCKSAQ